MKIFQRVALLFVAGRGLPRSRRKVWAQPMSSWAKPVKISP